MVKIHPPGLYSRQLMTTCHKGRASKGLSRSEPYHTSGANLQFVFLPVLLRTGEFHYQTVLSDPCSCYRLFLATVPQPFASWVCLEGCKGRGSRGLVLVDLVQVLAVPTHHPERSHRNHLHDGLYARHWALRLSGRLHIGSIDPGCGSHCCSHSLHFVRKTSRYQSGAGFLLSNNGDLIPTGRAHA